MLRPLLPIAPEDRKFGFTKPRHSNNPPVPWSYGDIGHSLQLRQPLLKGAGLLCDFCKGITLSALESPEGYTYSGKVLEPNAAKACRLCVLIRNTLKDAYISMVQNVDLDEKMNTNQAEEIFSEILNTETQNIILFAYTNAQIDLIPDPPFLKTNMGHPLCLNIYTPSWSSSIGITDSFIPCATMSEVVDLTLHWISECFETHQEGPKAIESPLPNRLLDLSCLDDTDHSVRLWLNPLWADEKEDYKGPMGTYVALNYCWGTRSFTTQTPENEDTMVGEINPACLPQTINDAVNITRSLRIRFLWVDALCILQGPCVKARNNWTEQSSQMASVYQNATVTIGAGTSVDAYQGFQYNTRSMHESLALLPSTWSSSKSHSPVFVGPDCSVAEPYFSILHTRGWTFQERLLWTRYVTFGLDGILWECAHARQFDNPYLENYYQDILAPKLPTSPTYSHWHDLIQDYSQRRLSKVEDRLIALAGVRAYFVRLRAAKDWEVAGLWANNLSWGLLWETQGFGENNDDPFGMAPSWSWASIPYVVSWSTAEIYGSIHTCHSDCVNSQYF